MNAASSALSGATNPGLRALSSRRMVRAPRRPFRAQKSAWASRSGSETARELSLSSRIRSSCLGWITAARWKIVSAGLVTGMLSTVEKSQSRMPPYSWTVASGNLWFEPRGAVTATAADFRNAKPWRSAADSWEATDRGIDRVAALRIVRLSTGVPGSAYTPGASRDHRPFLRRCLMAPSESPITESQRGVLHLGWRGWLRS